MCVKGARGGLWLSQNMIEINRTVIVSIKLSAAVKCNENVCVDEVCIEIFNFQIVSRIQKIKHELNLINPSHWII